MNWIREKIFQFLSYYIRYSFSFILYMYVLWTSVAVLSSWMLQINACRNIIYTNWIMIKSVFSPRGITKLWAGYGNMITTGKVLCALLKWFLVFVPKGRCSISITALGHRELQVAAGDTESSVTVILGCSLEPAYRDCPKHTCTML